jgi:hypothetical protein
VGAHEVRDGRDGDCVQCGTDGHKLHGDGVRRGTDERKRGLHRGRAGSRGGYAAAIILRFPVAANTSACIALIS